MNPGASLLAALCGASFLCALLMCQVLRGVAERRGLLDRPNDRSLHTVPVPRLGGVGIVVGVSITTALAMAWAPASDRGVVVLLTCAVVLAAVGLVDDLRGLGPGVRFVAQITLGLGFVLAVGVPTQVALTADTTVTLPYGVAVAAWTLFIVGVLNIYNFMDGMDGLAALQALGATAAIAAGLLAVGNRALAFVPLTLGAAALGFFVHNSPPAKIFLGDAGSTFVGFTFAGLALAGARSATPLPVLAVPVALAPFLLDGTYTILRRVARGEAIWRAHRLHLYQRAAAAGQSHHDVLVRYAAWIGCSAVASVISVQHGAHVAILSIAFASAGLPLVAFWVARLERVSRASTTAGV